MVYVALNALYTLYLKRIAIIDIFFIAVCLCAARADGLLCAGCHRLAVDYPHHVPAGAVLGFGKRYHEMGFEEYVKIKPNLQHYNRDLLDRLVMISGGSALLAYAIYAAEIANRIGKVEMTYTVIFVAFGLFRYLQSIYVYHQGGEPETVILKINGSWRTLPYGCSPLFL